MANTGVLVLAAGEGTRMKSGLPKTLHEVLFKPMLDWVLDAAEAAGVGDSCVVTGFSRERLEEHLAARRGADGPACRVCVQRERRGTGDAVRAAGEFLDALGDCADVLVLCGDAPFISADTIRGSLAQHRAMGAAATVITARAENPAGYGRIVRAENGGVTAIVEDRDACPEQKKIDEINSGEYWFQVGALKEALGKIGTGNAKGEYYLTDVLAVLVREGLPCGGFETDMSVAAAANDRAQLAALNETARRAVLRRLMENGVSVPCADGVMVGPDVTVGADTVLLPGTVLRGKTVIGSGCVFGPNSLAEDCTFGDGVVFNASQAYRSRVGDGVTIGPFAHLRPNTVLAEKVHVGDFVELKNSSIGVGTKVPHLTYVGDSDVGAGVNFGCGCVTVNYDGVNKHRTAVGDHAFIGCNTNLIAPVRVGNNAYTAAGSTITRDVPDDALAVARSRQQNKEDWVKRRRSGQEK